MAGFIYRGKQFYLDTVLFAIYMAAISYGPYGCPRWLQGYRDVMIYELKDTDRGFGHF